MCQSRLCESANVGLLNVYSRLEQMTQYTEDGSRQVFIIPEDSDQQRQEKKSVPETLGRIGTIMQM